MTYLTARGDNYRACSVGGVKVNDAGGSCIIKVILCFSQTDGFTKKQTDIDYKSSNFDYL